MEKLLKTRTAEPKSRLLAKLIRDLQKAERFETMADLTDAIKFRCAKLRIRWTIDELNAALALVESNTPLIKLPKAPRHPKEPMPEPEIFDKRAAAEFLNKLRLQIKAIR